MGGKAFLGIMKGVSFPRIPTDTYQHLKARHLNELKQVYRLVDSPREAPDKPDHGDIDFIVYAAPDGTTLIETTDRSEHMKAVTGATHCIKSGNRYNLAIPFRLDGEEEEELPAEVCYYQVDVNECKNELEWEQMLYFQSYGDLGMILGALAKANGLTLSLHGLKIPHSPECYQVEPFLLSTSFPDILLFFGLDIKPWRDGFPTIQSIFEWVASCRLFHPQSVADSLERQKRRADREMYHNFLAWVNETLRLRHQHPPVRVNQPSNNGNVGTKLVKADSDVMLASSTDAAAVKTTALIFFGKTSEYNNLISKERRRRVLKDNFNGHRVMEWTGLYGRPVKMLMDEVRKHLDAMSLESLSEEGIRELVLKTREEMPALSVV